ncbi:MAG: glycine cleavage system aminomethyltransferase GcvT [Candidatus Omnitrophota bacterium]
MQHPEQGKQTPLYAAHLRLGARMTVFGGYWMPLQYTGVIDEHLTVRQRAGLFDLSHMGEFRVSGPAAEAFLSKVLTGDVAGMRNGSALYTLLCNEDGVILDDLILYRTGGDQFLLAVNASNIRKDYEWIASHRTGENVRCEDVSEATSLIALQGPLAESILKKTPYRSAAELKRNAHQILERTVVARTGYTGEDGFELYTESQQAVSLWKTLFEAGKDAGLKPIGLGARDTLRLEAKLPLYGHDITEETTPYEAGLGWAVSLHKKNFVGKEALSRQHDTEPQKLLVGFEMMEQGIPRNGCPIWKDKVIGKVTSGTYGPSLRKNIGLGYVEKHFSNVGTELFVEIRGRKLRAQIVKTPFYKRSHV